MSANIEFMRSLENQYRQVCRLKNRSEYKIFYGQVFAAPILTLGLNPRGSSEETSEDGTRKKDGSVSSSSGSYFEKMENDILDCEWPENSGLRELLLPLVGNDYSRFRSEIVKSNMAFRRSLAVKDIDLAAAEHEAIPFIENIIARVNPRLIVLTGPTVARFLSLYALESRRLTETIKAANIKQVVFAAAAARLRSLDHEAIIVQVAHASRFAWTYEKYDVSAKIAELRHRATGAGDGTESDGQRTSNSKPAPLIAGSSVFQSPETCVTPPMRISDPRLAELQSRWQNLGIAHQFYRVHHFSSHKFSGKPESLHGFIAWCDRRDIRRENTRTLERALDLAYRMKTGEGFDEALAQSWAAYPIVRK